MDALRKYDSSHPGPKPTAPPPSSSSTPRYSNDDDGDAELEGYGDDGDAIDPRRREVLGTTPMPTASVTVVNQGKTRKSIISAHEDTHNGGRPKKLTVLP